MSVKAVYLISLASVLQDLQVSIRDTRRLCKVVPTLRCLYSNLFVYHVSIVEEL